MLKALIVEDEYLAREELTYLIESHSNIEIIATFDDGLEAFKYLQTHKVDIAFLDINVPSIDGMLLARNIHQFSEKPHIVFTTAYKEFAVDAFELEAFDYLLKPLNEKRIIGLLAKLEATQACLAQPEEVRAKTINLIKDNRIFVTAIDDIYYAMANEKVTSVFTKDDAFIVPFTMSELINRLPEQHFFRCHRSYCVNIAKIQEIIPWVNCTYQLKVHDIGSEIPVSRSNIKAFRELMQL
ncbi:LytTR family DNA-binding domain-containing protein [Moritella sp. F3]|uniref:LytR/AlgR family response regulator transcription factor n=1 Tax=Moritella sp. F3 TaxID=2718882 RepID=UPI001A35940B|nr:LytTR family DNA-binding domain-containing protein [Moritella sp. F3]GIC75539.1 DNA-binding response regulator [Moritella sp. F1]GIC80684.1 DNA-binding response regulator [Moritella sp. F3]